MQLFRKFRPVNALNKIRVRQLINSDFWGTIESWLAKSIKYESVSSYNFLCSIMKSLNS